MKKINPMILAKHDPVTLLTNCRIVCLSSKTMQEIKRYRQAQSRQVLWITLLVIGIVCALPAGIIYAVIGPYFRTAITSVIFVCMAALILLLILCFRHKPLQHVKAESMIREYRQAYRIPDDTVTADVITNRRGNRKKQTAPTPTLLFTDQNYLCLAAEAVMDDFGLIMIPLDQFIKSELRPKICFVYPYGQLENKQGPVGLNRGYRQSKKLTELLKHKPPVLLHTKNSFYTNATGILTFHDGRTEYTLCLPQYDYTTVEMLLKNAVTPHIANQV